MPALVTRAVMTLPVLVFFTRITSSIAPFCMAVPGTVTSTGPVFATICTA